jgi:hypothetical protein
MKRISLAIAVAAVLGASFKSAADIAAWGDPLERANGYHLGFMTSPIESREALLLTSLEGTLWLGVIGGHARARINGDLSEIGMPMQPDESDDDFVEVSPFRFSTSRAERPRLAALNGKMVLLNYSKRRFGLSDPAFRTANALRDIYLASGRPFKPMQMRSRLGSMNFVYSGLGRGDIAGRIVDVSFIGGIIYKTWEIVVQLGEGGDNYFLMTIPDTALARYAVLCMATGNIVNLSFTRARAHGTGWVRRLLSTPSHAIRFGITEYDVYEIRQLAGAEGGANANGGRGGEAPRDIPEVSERDIRDRSVPLGGLIERCCGGATGPAAGAASAPASEL